MKRFAFGVLITATVCIVGYSLRSEPGDGARARGNQMSNSVAGGQLDRRTTDLRRAVDHFIEAADRSDSAIVAAMYAPDFVNVRISDEGDVVRMERGQLLTIFGRAGGHHIPTRSTAVQHVEVIGDTGLVLLTRIKDIGNGWEPMFYSLVWKREGEKWLLLREFVHQRSLPKSREQKKQ